MREGRRERGREGGRERWRRELEALSGGGRGVEVLRQRCEVLRC
jgi:hypothetical protein